MCVAAISLRSSILTAVSLFGSPVAPFEPPALFIALCCGRYGCLCLESAVMVLCRAPRCAPDWARFGALLHLVAWLTEEAGRFYFAGSGSWALCCCAASSSSSTSQPGMVTASLMVWYCEPLPLSLAGGVPQVGLSCVESSGPCDPWVFLYGSMATLRLLPS